MPLLFCYAVYSHASLHGTGTIVYDDKLYKNLNLANDGYRPSYSDEGNFFHLYHNFISETQINQ